MRRHFVARILSIFPLHSSKACVSHGHLQHTIARSGRTYRKKGLASMFSFISVLWINYFIRCFAIFEKNKSFLAQTLEVWLTNNISFQHKAQTRTQSWSSIPEANSWIIFLKKAVPLHTAILNPNILFFIELPICNSFFTNNVILISVFHRNLPQWVGYIYMCCFHVLKQLHTTISSQMIWCL